VSTELSNISSLTLFFAVSFPQEASNTIDKRKKKLNRMFKIMSYEL
jgi:hypothetical protein